MTTPGSVLVVFGTRPEAIKLAPVVRQLERDVAVRVCVTGQHRQMLDQVLRAFDIEPSVDLDLMREGQDLFQLTAAALQSLGRVMSADPPCLVIVQGDTTTSFAAALSAYYLHLSVAHVEAGLRTGDKTQPFPEEVNRRFISTLADWHFAPTSEAQANLIAEHVPRERIFVTGNTGIDALLTVVKRLETGSLQPRLPAGVEAELAGRRLILVTGHRRESFGPKLEDICRTLQAIVESHTDVVVVYPVHPNPNVREPVNRLLKGKPRIVLIPPLDYVDFVALMRRATLILTDSGGVQEEAPSIGKPVLVLRQTTERPEGIKAGVARLVGTDVQQILAVVEQLLRDADAHAAMARAANPYGDGHAAERIAALVREILSGKTPAKLPRFAPASCP